MRTLIPYNYMCVFIPTECLVSETRPNLSPMGRLYLKADRDGKGKPINKRFIWTLTYQDDN
jgi:hypothetical protein